MNDGLKQRLIGALVLVGIAVIFLPGFFKEQQLHQVDTRTQIPARPDTVEVVIEAPKPILDESLPDPDRLYLPRSNQPVAEQWIDPESEGKASASSLGIASAASSSVQASTPQVASTSQPQRDRPPKRKDQSASSTPKLDAWVVQVASLRSSESAQALRKRLQEKGYKAYVRLAQTGQGEVSRVFIGPKLDRALAEAVKQEVDPVFKVNSMVLRFKP
ncbi:SPOR domain-containing protein [Gilvimarinus agarilyticus]|uniref:SPOR domain-containing protein n=1 Tax=Gilvimarinus sp. 2_MG-2023 TaxID=3062666 RepID=UPI001C0A2F94|nr:SPOR domain-containing protein [Gilvimarinus sp. 2_MG-2023]MBU2885089.1 SPOR domain-containing protein [Gilvimarinus agarilyticus]MDO6569986.1 SPOR domain-containing protein [Gilvimarinus sp. 2_MG-2023]